MQTAPVQSACGNTAATEARLSNPPLFAGARERSATDRTGPQDDARPAQRACATPTDDDCADIYRRVFSELRDHHLSEAREFMRKGHNAIMPRMDEKLVSMLHDALDQTSTTLNTGLPLDVKDLQWQHDALKALTSLGRGLSVDAFRHWLRDELNADRQTATRARKKCLAQMLARALNDTLRTLIHALNALRTYACIKQPGGAREALLSALSTDLGNADTAALSGTLARLSADDACSRRMRALEAAMSNEVFVALAEQALQCRRAAKQAHQVARRLTVARQPDAQHFFARAAAFLLQFSRELSDRMTVAGVDANEIGDGANEIGDDTNEIGDDTNEIGDDADRTDDSDPGVGEGNSRPRPPGTRWERLVATFKRPVQRTLGQAYFATLIGCLKAQQACRSGVHVAGERLGAPRETMAADVAVRCVLWQWQQPVHQLQHVIAALQYKLKLLARIEQAYQSARADTLSERCTVSWRNTGTAFADVPDGAGAAHREIDDDVRQWLLDRAEQIKPGVRQRRELQILMQLLEADVDAARKVITGVGTTQRDVEEKLLAAMASTEAMVGEQHDPGLFKALRKCVPDVAHALCGVADTLSKCLGAAGSNRCDLTLAKEKAGRAQLKAAALSEHLSAASSAVTQRPLDCRSPSSRLAVHWARQGTAAYGADLPACSAARLHTFMRDAGLLEGVCTAGDPQGYLLATRLHAEIENIRSGRATSSMRPDQYVAMQKRTMEFILQWSQSRLMRYASRQFAKAALDGAVLTLSLGNAILVKAGFKLACAAITIPYKVNTLNKYVMPGEDIDYESVFRLLGQQLNRLGFRLITTPAPWAAKVAAGAVVTAAGRYYNNRLAAQEGSVSVIYEIVAENRKSERMALDWRRGLLPTVATDSAFVTAGMLRQRAECTGASEPDDTAVLRGGPAACAVPGRPSGRAEAEMQDDPAPAGRRTRRHAGAPGSVREAYVAVQDMRQLTKAQSEKSYAESIRKLLDAASGDRTLPSVVRARALRAAGGEASLVPVTLTRSHIPLINIFFLPDEPGSPTGLLFSLSRVRPRWRYLSEKSDFPSSYFKTIGGAQFYVQTTEGQPSFIQGAVTSAGLSDDSAMHIVNRKVARECLRKGQWRFEDLNMSRCDVQDLDTLSATLSANSRFYKYGKKIGFLTDYPSCGPDRFIGKLHRQSDIEHLAQQGASDSFLVRLLDESIRSYQDGPCFGGPSLAENQTFVQSAADARARILNASTLQHVVTAFNTVYDHKITPYDVFKGRFLDGMATNGDVAEMSPSGASVYEIFASHGEAHLASQNIVSERDGEWDGKQYVVPNAEFEKLPEAVRRSAYVRGIDRRLHAIALSPSTPPRLRQSAMAALNGKRCLLAVTVGGVKLADIFFVANEDRPATGWLINLNSSSDLFVFIQEKQDVPADYFDNVTGNRLCQDPLPGVVYREMGRYEAVTHFRAVNPVGRDKVVLSFYEASWNFDDFIEALQRTEPVNVNVLADEMVKRRRLHRYARPVDFAVVATPAQDEPDYPQLLKWISDALIEGQSVLAGIKGPEAYIGDWIRKRGLNPDRSVAVEITVGTGPRKRIVKRVYRFRDFVSGKALHELGKRITTSEFQYHLTDDEKILTGMREQAQADYDLYLTKLERSHTQTLDAYMTLSQIAHKVEGEGEGVAESDQRKKFFRLASRVRSGEGVRAGGAAAFFSRLRATLNEETYTSSELTRSHVLNVLGELVGTVSVLPAAGVRVGLCATIMKFAVAKLQEQNASAPAEKEMYRKAAAQGLLYDVVLQAPGVWRSAGRTRVRGAAGRTGTDSNPGTVAHSASATRATVPGARTRPIAPSAHAATVDAPDISHHRLPSADKRPAIDVSLDGLGLQRQGIYRNTYPLMSDGEMKHFIKYDGRACEVFWDASLGTLRIFDPDHPIRGGYHPPVRFEGGRWQTHSHVGLQGGAKDADALSITSQYVTVRRQAPSTVGKYAYNLAPRIVKGVINHGTWKGERGILPSFDASLRVGNVPVESLTRRQLVMQGPYAGAYRHDSGRHFIIQDDFVFEVVRDPVNAVLRLKDSSSGALGPEILFDATGDGWKFARATRQ